MQWPEIVTIVDDTENGARLKETLCNLSWFETPESFFKMHKESIEFAKASSRQSEVKLQEIKALVSDLPNPLLDLARREPEFFKEITEFIQIRDEPSVVRALDRLRVNQWSIAFIDFDHSHVAPAFARLEREFQEIDPKWQSFSAPTQMGGCVFAATFNPADTPPQKLLCHTSANPPYGIYEVVGNAITPEPYSLWQGPIQYAKAVIGALKKWIELQNWCPLDAIWEMTDRVRWFQDDIPNSSISTYSMPHDPSAALAKTVEYRRTHCETIKAVFGLAELPDAWWQTAESLENIHESIKHLCGVCYQGSAAAAALNIDRRNLSIGSAYFIALLALKQVRPDKLSFLLNGVPDFGRLIGVRCSIFPPQDRKTAQEAAKALYYTFCHLFKDDLKHSSSVSSLHLSDDGRTLSIGLEGWDPPNVSRDIARWRKNDKQALYPADFVACVCELQKLAATSSQGFGGPGVISMVNDPCAEFRISSIEEPQ